MSLKSATIQPHLYKTPPFSIESPGYKPIEGETIPRRHPLCADALKVTPEEGINTVFDVFLRTKIFSDARAIGTRKLIKIHNETVKQMVDGKEVTKNWKYYELSGYHYLSYKEYTKLALEIGCGFRKLGLVKEDRIHIFAATSASWLASAHGAISQSMPIVTAYATLGAEGLEHSLVQTHAKAIIVDPELITTLLNPLKKAQDINFVIYNSQYSVKKSDIDHLKSAHPHLTILSLEELRQLGENEPLDSVPPDPDDLCCIMYTSGSTGPPKGVPLTHRNIVAAITGINVVVGPYVGPNDSMLTYLPLAHSFEFAIENACLYLGIPMGYGSPKTLSDLSMKNCKGDIKEFKPTILVGVPAVWETIRKGIEGRIEKQNALKKMIFWGALKIKRFLCAWYLPGEGIIDRKVFKIVRDEMGGRLRACLNGAGPISLKTRRFISFVVAPLINGYGLTETTAMGALMDPFEWTDDTIGTIPGCIEIKLVDFPEAGYFAANDPPQGEVLIRGDAVMKSYYENEEETAAAFTADGWFKTGDIGEWATNGHLKIIDRKKYLVKTLNGEYIALEKLESVYRSSSVVGNICVYAFTDRSKPIAIVFPAKEALRALAKSNNLQNDVRDTILHELVLQELQRTGIAAGLASFEILEGVVLTDLEWTPQNGFLTAAQKLNRRKILKDNQSDIDKIYAKTSKL